MGSAKINFDVPKTWVVSNNIDPDSVLLLRYANGWNELPTTNTGETADAYNYEASSPGLSVFSITGKQAAPPAPVPVCTPGSRTCLDPNTRGICRPDGSGYDTIPCPAGCESGQCKTIAPAFIAITPSVGVVVSVIIIIVLVFMIAYFYRRGKSHRKTGFHPPKL